MSRIFLRYPIPILSPGFVCHQSKVTYSQVIKRHGAPSKEQVFETFHTDLKNYLIIEGAFG
jgi:hypothetical protein